MILIVENKNITESFIPYLKKRIIGYIAIKMELKKLDKYDEYFNSNKFSTNRDVTINSRKVIVLGISNLQHKRYETTTHIFINPNICYPGTDYKVVDLCKIINFGTLSIDGYPIFTNTFEYFSKHIKHYVDKCAMGLG